MSWMRWTVALMGALAISFGVGFLFYGEQIKRAVFQSLTSDMFVSVDDDSFDPGLSVGSAFPLLEATLGEIPVRDLSSLVGDRGMIFIASRSVDW
ncbi:MAG: hypothetical protein CBD42_002745 [Gammaproteobacteria bacterium TMED182]|nr:hypothetical protein [Gammaproteobacteria bacterium]RPG55329.1 MAG: hypothetical protein CBD42_002745 [Gammaproteobacteria bacterium TMED182]